MRPVATSLSPENPGVTASARRSPFPGAAPAALLPALGVTGFPGCAPARLPPDPGLGFLVSSLPKAELFGKDQ